MSSLITSVLDGYNVCMMAYGQTGSGKTFTMEGPEENPGVYRRALAELFRCVGAVWKCRGGRSSRDRGRQWQNIYHGGAGGKPWCLQTRTCRAVQVSRKV